MAGYANLLDKDKYGIKLMSGEALGYTYNYYKPTIKDTAARKYIDILGGHLYGHAPLKYMVQAASEAFGYGIESWMTEHVVDPRSDTDGDSQSDTKVIDLPTWREQTLSLPKRSMRSCRLSAQPMSTGTWCRTIAS